MSTILIAILSILVTVLIICVVGLIDGTINDWNDLSKFKVAMYVCVSLLVFIGGVFLGIGLTTEHERVYIAKYESQKATIEYSLASDEITGMERVQLVTKAVEINGELAERKAKFERWHYCTFDSSLYDDVEPIIFK